MEKDKKTVTTIKAWAMHSAQRYEHFHPKVAMSNSANILGVLGQVESSLHDLSFSPDQINIRINWNVIFNQKAMGSHLHGVRYSYERRLRAHYGVFRPVERLGIKLLDPKDGLPLGLERKSSFGLPYIVLKDLLSSSDHIDDAKFTYNVMRYAQASDRGQDFVRRQRIVYSSLDPVRVPSCLVA